MTKISDAEWKIMNVLWDEQPRTMTQITKELAEDTGWTKHTVMTYLKRLEKKELVHYEEGAKAKLYYANVERQMAVVEEKKNFLDKVFRGNVGLMMSSLLEQDDIPPEEIDMLIELLEKKREK